MKINQTRFITLLIFLISFSMIAQRIFETPPGTIKINDTLFIDKAPIDNFMYEEFMLRVHDLWTYTLNDSLKSLELHQIDKSLATHSLNKDQNEEIYNKVTEVQDLKLPGNIDISMYFRHPRYYDHPVIGISKEIAELYCTWRTDMVNLLWSKKIKNSGQNYHKIKYRLPTSDEYILATKYFSNNNKLLFINKNSPLQINLKDLRKTEQFMLFKHPEFTSGDQYFIKYSSKLKDRGKKKDKYIFFRCICEVEK